MEPPSLTPSQARAEGKYSEGLADVAGTHIQLQVCSCVCVCGGGGGRCL